MTGSGGLFVPKIQLKAYFDNAAGLRVGAPVRLQGVDIGNVKTVRIIPGRQPNAVEVMMKISTRYNESIRKDSVAQLSTAGVLGEVFVDIDSTQAKAGQVQDGDTLAQRDQPEIQDVVRSTQTTLQNMDVLLRRVDRIVSFVESGEGSIGKLIYDPGLYNRLNITVSEFQSIMTDVRSGKGTIGKLIIDDQLYVKANDSIDKLNRIVTELNAGQGTMGKFLKDPSLYDNANQTIAKANKLMDDVNAGQGALGLLAKDPQFRAKVNDTVVKLNMLAEKINNGDGTAGRFINDPSLYANTNQMLMETRSLVQAIRENPKRYLTIRFRLF